MEFYDYQKLAIEQLKSGSILCGGVGSGKSRTAIGYYFLKECNGILKSRMRDPKDLYIITTAKKRDSLEWEKECAMFALSTRRDCSLNNVKVTIDSWNNISKYVSVKNAFFIFDEQRLVGSGAWVKSFLKIVKLNKWILLSATPGDTWSDYIPVFIANRFYKNRTEFLRRHAVYNRFTKYPKVEKYMEESYLLKLKKQITVTMDYKRITKSNNKIINVSFDKEAMDNVMIKRWDIFKEQPIKSISELCYIMRKVANSDPSRIEATKQIIQQHSKIIIFYNFDYELELLKELGSQIKIPTAEWNGHAHQEIPNTKKWIYLVQYTAGAEGWNCIKTDTILFYSQNYSYKTMTQAAGRIDRLNTPFSILNYYHLRSDAVIDLAIAKALKRKRDFNINKFMDI